MKLGEAFDDQLSDEELQAEIEAVRAEISKVEALYSDQELRLNSLQEQKEGGDTDSAVRAENKLNLLRKEKDELQYCAANLQRARIISEIRLRIDMLGKELISLLPVTESTQARAHQILLEMGKVVEEVLKSHETWYMAAERYGMLDKRKDEIEEKKKELDSTFRGIKSGVDQFTVLVEESLKYSVQLESSLKPPLKEKPSLRERLANFFRKAVQEDLVK